MAFSDYVIELVWQKGRIVSGNDPAQWRQDECGAWMGRGYYGSRNSQYGWEIDHIHPVSQGGTDHISNLRPLQWENNASKQDGRLQCAVGSSGAGNVRRR